eukprot:CAMPEP_0119268474 /NCGR_PEP_ID=MMETSP1329-20130426/6250_1 /TAXON_ID=114041 /ORGANISM="Genus nov. species nov., Strain RCC1024" /LENGTH=50 /DNA_ID=CAMNT_0007268447 /DNA_START=68 /DNA_END=216 /DNA_ORIENTATION=-
MANADAPVTGDPVARAEARSHVQDLRARSSTAEARSLGAARSTRTRGGAP